MPHRRSAWSMMRTNTYESLDIYTRSLKDQGYSSKAALKELGARYKDGKPRHQQNASVQRIYFGIEAKSDRQRAREQFKFEASQMREEKPKTKKQRDTKGRFIKEFSDTKHAKHAEAQRRYRERHHRRRKSK